MMLGHCLQRLFHFKPILGQRLPRYFAVMLYPAKNVDLLFVQLLRRCLNIKSTLGSTVFGLVATISIAEKQTGRFHCRKNDLENIPSPTNKIHYPNSVVTLVHRLRRWTNVTTALGQCLVLVSINRVEQFQYLTRLSGG